MKFKLSREKISADKDVMKANVHKMLHACDRRCTEEGYQRPPARRSHIRYKSSARTRHLRQMAALRSNRRSNAI